MTSIFNLFGNITEPDKGQSVKPLARSKTTVGISENPGKNVSGQPKPKGLSIRSNSDLNVCVSSHSSKQDSLKKPQEISKPKLKEATDYHISAKTTNTTKKLHVLGGKTKELSPKQKSVTKSPIKNIKPHKFSESSIFKKPLPPKGFVKRSSFPMPESLAPYSQQLEFDDSYDICLENEFKNLILKKIQTVKPYEDEGFESDPEQLSVSEIPTILRSPVLSDKEYTPSMSPELPEISDDEVF